MDEPQAQPLEYPMLEISDIYESVKDDLSQVEQHLFEVCRVDLLPLQEMLSYVIEGQGKMVRPVVTLLASKLYPGSDPKEPIKAATVMELLHLATLIHDDTVDQAETRRGRTTVSSRWGTNIAILLGDYLFSIAASLACDVGEIAVSRHTAQAIAGAAQGELDELLNAFNWQQTREDYWQRTYHKTGALFSAAAETGAAVSSAPDPVIRAMKNYGANLGIAFQVVDDILDFQGTAGEFGKPVGQDLFQGTLTLPSLLLIERFPKNNPVIKAFQGTNRNENIKLAIEMICNESILPDCHRIAGEFASEAQRALSDVEDSRYKRSLSDLAHYVVDRRS